MPHILVNNLNEFDLKDTNFTFIAKNQEIELIGIKKDGVEFLLSKIDREGNSLIKYDKVTRVANLELIKSALKEFSEVSKANVISGNINSKHTHHQKERDSFVKDIEFFLNEFKPNCEVWIEIGFGTGRHLLHQAKKNPNIIFIGLEIYKPSIDKVLKQIELQNLNNLYLIDYDARIFLEFMKSNSIGKIFVHFPVPWDKKPHRRVFSKVFIEEAIRVLKVDGRLELRSDSDNYFNYSLGLFLNLNRVNFEVKKNIDLEISSKYEDRWKKQQKDIYDLHLINLEESIERKIVSDFGFEKEVDFLEIEKRFENRIFKHDDFILHFENIYKIDEKSGLIRVTLGDFDKPERKYILIKNGKVRYFQGIPIPSRANLKSHQKIKEWLNG